MAHLTPWSPQKGCVSPRLRWRRSQPCHDAAFRGPDRRDPTARTASRARQAGLLLVVAGALILVGWHTETRSPSLALQAARRLELWCPAYGIPRDTIAWRMAERYRVGSGYIDFCRGLSDERRVAVEAARWRDRVSVRPKRPLDLAGREPRPGAVARIGRTVHAQALSRRSGPSSARFGQRLPDWPDEDPFPDLSAGDRACVLTRRVNWSRRDSGRISQRRGTG
jgi:hypothetical protein